MIMSMESPHKPKNCIANQ